VAEIDRPITGDDFGGGVAEIVKSYGLILINTSLWSTRTQRDKTSSFVQGNTDSVSA